MTSASQPLRHISNKSTKTTSWKVEYWPTSTDAKCSGAFHRGYPFLPLWTKPYSALKAGVMLGKVEKERRQKVGAGRFPVLTPTDSFIKNNMSYSLSSWFSAVEKIVSTSQKQLLINIESW